MPAANPPDFESLWAEKDMGGLIESLHKKHPLSIHERALLAINRLWADRQFSPLTEVELDCIGEDQLATLYDMLSHEEWGVRATSVKIIGERGGPKRSKKYLPC